MALGMIISCGVPLPIIRMCTISRCLRYPSRGVFKLIISGPPVEGILILLGLFVAFRSYRHWKSVLSSARFVLSPTPTLTPTHTPTTSTPTRLGIHSAVIPLHWQILIGHSPQKCRTSDENIGFIGHVSVCQYTSAMRGI